MTAEIDHKNYPKTLRTKTEKSLRYIIVDCKAAIKAMPNNPKNGYYADEINYCAMELNRRKHVQQRINRQRIRT